MQSRLDRLFAEHTLNSRRPSALPVQTTTAWANPPDRTILGSHYTSCAGQYPKPREQGAIPDGATASMRVAQPLWGGALAVGDLGGSQPLPRHLLPGCELDRAWSDDGAGADGPRAPSSRRKLENGAGLASGEGPSPGVAGELRDGTFCVRTVRRDVRDVEGRSRVDHRVSTFCRIEGR